MTLPIMHKKLLLATLLIALSVIGAGTLSAVSARPAYASAIATTAGDSPDILVTPLQGPTVAQRLSTRTKSTWPWYITRAAGLVAAVSLVALMLSGVGLITGYTFKLLEPLTAWATHRALGFLFGASVIVHIVALLFDRYIPFTIAQVLVPFASGYRNVSIAGHQLGSLYVALGVFALYGILAIIISSLLWIDKKPYTWKLFHFLAYLVMIFVFFHALYLGTDLTHGVFRGLWIIFSVTVALVVLYRLRRARTS